MTNWFLFMLRETNRELKEVGCPKNERNALRVLYIVMITCIPGLVTAFFILPYFKDQTLDNLVELCIGIFVLLLVYYGLIFRFEPIYKKKINDLDQVQGRQEGKPDEI